MNYVCNFCIDDSSFKITKHNLNAMFHIKIETKLDLKWNCSKIWAFLSIKSIKVQV